MAPEELGERWRRAKGPTGGSVGGRHDRGVERPQQISGDEGVLGQDWQAGGGQDAEDGGDRTVNVVAGGCLEGEQPGEWVQGSGQVAELLAGGHQRLSHRLRGRGSCGDQLEPGRVVLAETQQQDSQGCGRQNEPTVQTVATGLSGEAFTQCGQRARGV